jgi:hypothetical protein
LLTSTSLGVEADKRTLTPQDFAKVILSKLPMQLCMFLKVLIGTEETVQIMVQAIGVAKQI